MALDVIGVEAGLEAFAAVHDEDGLGSPVTVIVELGEVTAGRFGGIDRNNNSIIETKRNKVRSSISRNRRKRKPPPTLSWSRLASRSYGAAAGV